MPKLFFARTSSDCWKSTQNPKTIHKNKNDLVTSFVNTLQIQREASTIQVMPDFRKVINDFYGTHFGEKVKEWLSGSWRHQECFYAELPRIGIMHKGWRYRLGEITKNALSIPSVSVKAKRRYGRKWKPRYKHIPLKTSYAKTFLCEN